MNWAPTWPTTTPTPERATAPGGQRDAALPASCACCRPSATGVRPAVYFDWGEGNPLLHLLRYVLSVHGDVPPLTREIIRRAEPDPARRPAVYVGV